MAAPALIQTDNAESGGGTTAVVTLPSVAAGSTLIVWALQYVSSNRSYSVSDSNGDTWTSVRQITDSGGTRLELFYAEGVTGGSTTITLSSNFSTSFAIVAIEIEESSLDVSGEIDNPAGATQYAALSGDIDTAANVFVVAGHQANAGTGITNKSGWSSAYLVTTGKARSVQYLASDAAMNNERGEITVATTTRFTIGIIGSFKAPVGGGGAVIQDYYYRQQMAVLA